MQAFFEPTRHPNFSCAKVLVCALLACLFLYNPFQAANHGYGNLTVCHPVSYRATVASSEVEQFAPPATAAVVLVDARDVIDRFVLQVAANSIERRHPFPLEAAAPPQAGFSSSLRFRPPPSA